VGRLKNGEISPSKSGVQIAATMSLKFLLETQMVILMLCNSVLMRLLTTSALSFFREFRLRVTSSIFSTTTRTYHSLRISTEPMITQSAQPPLPFLTAGEGPPETARLASVTRRSVSPWIVPVPALPGRRTVSLQSDRTALLGRDSREAYTSRRSYRSTDGTDDDVVSGENDQSPLVGVAAQLTSSRCRQIFKADTPRL